MIELMMALAIIGILSSIALPSYQAYMYRAKAVQVVEVMDKLRTVLSGFQAEKGTIGTEYCLHTTAGRAPDSPAIEYFARGNSKQAGWVQGISSGELAIDAVGIQVYVSNCVTSTASAGQFVVLLSPVRRDDTRARQVALAVRDVMKGQAYRSSATGSGTVSLYFQL